MKEMVYIFPILFIGVLLLIFFVLSKKGWAVLAAEYECINPFQGTRAGIISAGINGVSYSNCLTLKYNEEGFYLRPIVFFRLFHKPLFIPWKAIKAVRDKQVLFVRLKELVIGEPAIALVQFPKATFSKIEQMIYVK